MYVYVFFNDINIYIYIFKLLYTYINQIKIAITRFRQCTKDALDKKK